MSIPPAFPASGPSRYWPLASLLTLLVLGGCAQLPPEQASPDMMTANKDTFASQQSLAGTAAAWPQQQWWQQYGDAQLDQLISEGLASSPDMTIAAARVRAAAAFSDVTASATSPQLSANVDITKQKQSYNYLTPDAFTPQGWNNYGLATLNLNWEIDFWGKNSAALASAISSLQASQAELADARLTLAANIATRYAELAQLFASRDTLMRALEIRNQTLELINQRYDNGLETLGSRYRAESRKANAENDLLAIDESIALKRNQLAALLGQGPDRGLAIERPAIKLDKEFALPDQVALELLGRRPDISAARLQVEAMASEEESRKAAFYPNVNLSAYFGLQSIYLDQLVESGSTVGSVGPAISLPIFNGGRLRAQLRDSQAQYDLAVGSYNQTVTHALQQVADTAVSQKALNGRISKAEEAYQAAQHAWQIAQNRYQGGLDSYLDVLSAEDLLLGNLQTLTDLRSRSFVLDIAMQRALGGGYQQASEPQTEQQQVSSAE
ncbi:efflux transporter outer membrane subunit [Oceanobacter mangrovi]|uniref:efflux transporter outer membrane subunit n=1 Tax=Oceanobacter mangrovi TaxID=2862510 RepID=UPI001C8E169C|nr:efflux transporter outer membrane subunit [Oceanobacter mangrovi]